MPRSILIGLDGSPDSAAAVELALAWAKRHGSLLVGLGVVDAPTIMHAEPVPLGAGAFKAERDETVLAEARHTVEQFLETFALRCTEAGVSSKLLEDVGLPAEQIMLEAQRYDLIMLGQETHFHFQTQTRPDETLHSVLKHCPRPVVAVPKSPAGGSSVVVAYDGSVCAARALQAFQGVGLASDRPVHIVSIGDDHVAAAKRAERAVEYLRFQEIEAQPHAIVSHSIAPTILEQVRSLDAGLLVMGAHGHSGWKELIFGSVTKSVLSACPVPMFLYH